MSEGPTTTTTPLAMDHPAVIAKLTAQVKKLTEANAKYKNLLKLAKERIQQQEDELESLRQEKSILELKIGDSHSSAASVDDNTLGDDPASASEIVRVCQCVKVGNHSSSGGDDNNHSSGEIWALLELEHASSSNGGGPTHEILGDAPAQRWKEWKRFDSAQQLQDFVRRDAGEPLTLPPYSLTPEQSRQIQKEAAKEVAALNEEHRRFRIQAELARQQATAHIRDLQAAQKQSAAQRIIESANGGGGAASVAVNGDANGTGVPPNNSHRLTVLEGQVEKLQAEIVSQEAYWKDAYDTLLAENAALKSSGSEALLASQWRVRYEQSQHEMAQLQEAQKQKEAAELEDAQKYESKYRDLKESFRLYRKKAKELFETSPYSAAAGGSNNGNAADPALLSALADGSADAKLHYLRNLMVNYFVADATVRNHMEGAIGTLLQFSTDDVEKIEKKRQEAEAWVFY